jgi:DNA-binding FadR family transcriptional regulator
MYMPTVQRTPTPAWRGEKPALIAEDLRRRILGGELADHESLGTELNLVDRYGVSRPCLREALRILETEGFVTVRRGAGGGVTVHAPAQRITARTAAMYLQAQNVPLSDVHDARASIEPFAARTLAEARRTQRTDALRRLTELIDQQEQDVEDAAAFGSANAAFHHLLVSLAGNRTLAILTEVLDEIVTSAVDVTALAADRSVEERRRGIRSQRHLLDLIATGDGEGAEAHWRRHLVAVGDTLLGEQATEVVDGTYLHS